MLSYGPTGLDFDGIIRNLDAVVLSQEADKCFFALYAVKISVCRSGTMMKSSSVCYDLAEVLRYQDAHILSCVFKLRFDVLQDLLGLWEFLSVFLRTANNCPKNYVSVFVRKIFVAWATI